MFRHRLAAGAFALTFAAAPAAHAATDADLAEIREQIRQLKESYEARIQALEQRVKEAEAKAAGGAAAAPAATSAAAPPPPPASPTVSASAGASTSSGIAAFNPAISAVLQGVYANLSQDPNQYAIAGFVPSGDIVPAKRGFSIAESELGLSANVDDKFYGNLIFSLSPENTVEVEEAYGIFTAAPYGLAPKFGRFLSSIGYQNDQHQHAWDFYDAPLVYQAFLGGQFQNNGLQLKWIAPTETFVELGAEIGSGEAFPGTDRNKNGIGNGNAYVHLGGDVGASNSWRAGVSYLQTAARDRDYTQTDFPANDAAALVLGTNATRDRRFRLEMGAERQCAARRTSSCRANISGAASTATSPTTRTARWTSRRRADYRSAQSGFYVQCVWQFMPQWRVGGRYDWLDPGNVDYGANGIYLVERPLPSAAWRVMLDWTPSEFSRFRIQYQQAKLRPDFTDNEIFVQYILTLGAHGAHKF